MKRDAFVVALLISTAICAIRTELAFASEAEEESLFITNVRQLVFEGKRAGEGYFSADGSKMVFQSERETDNPFYQIYVLNLETGDTVRISPGAGKTTCAWLHPDGKRVMFSSTHEDPATADKAKAEFDLRAAGKSKRYKFEYDPEYEIYQASADGSGDYVNLTKTHGYDAEGSYSPDGTKIAFASNRSAYAGELSGDDAKRLEIMPEYFLDIYIMNADGSDVQRLTDVRGYDGGPFFSPDGKRICWRRFNEEGTLAEIWTMNIDGSDAKQLTHLNAMSWAPFYHPSGDYLVFTTNLHGFSNFELYLVDVDGAKKPVRVTHTEKFDGLPVFLPDGKRIAWTCQRTSEGDAQIFIGDWNDGAARKKLGLGSTRAASDAFSCTPDFELPATSAGVSTADLDAHVKAMAAMGSREQVVDYVAAAFCKLGLLPAGDDATMFQTCELRKRVGGEAVERVGCNVLAGLFAKGKGHGRNTVVVGANVAGGEDGAALHGIAGMLEVAEFLAELNRSGKLALKRDVVFAAFVGEPISAAFVAEGIGMAMKPEPGAAPPVAAYIGLDAIGTLGDGKVHLSGVGSSAVWSREIERRNAPVGLRIAAENAPNPETSGFHFYAAGVPAISVTTAASADAQGAEADSEGAARIARFASLVARAIGTAQEAPEFTPIREHPKGSAGRPYLGTEPDYLGSGPGVKLTGVKEGAPAHQAGVRAGDVIVELGGKAIKDVHAYAAVLDELKPNMETAIVVMRDGKRVEFKITPGSRE